MIMAAAIAVLLCLGGCSGMTSTEWANLFWPDEVSLTYGEGRGSFTTPGVTHLEFPSLRSSTNSEFWAATVTIYVPQWGEPLVKERTHGHR